MIARINTHSLLFDCSIVRLFDCSISQMVHNWDSASPCWTCYVVPLSTCPFPAGAAGGEMLPSAAETEVDGPAPVRCHRGPPRTPRGPHAGPPAGVAIPVPARFLRVLFLPCSLRSCFSPIPMATLFSCASLISLIPIPTSLPSGFGFSSGVLFFPAQIVSFSRMSLNRGFLNGTIFEDQSELWITAQLFRFLMRLSEEGSKAVEKEEHKIGWPEGNIHGVVGVHTRTGDAATFTPVGVRHHRATHTTHTTRTSRSSTCLLLASG